MKTILLAGSGALGGYYGGIAGAVIAVLIAECARRFTAALIEEMRS